LHEPQQQANQCRLARAVGSKQSEYFTALDLQSALVERCEVAKPFRQFSGLDHGGDIR
jgi:hypothetical protein